MSDMTIPTAAEVAAIRERAEKVISGTWFTGAFVEFARHTLPLCAAVEALRADNERLRAALAPFAAVRMPPEWPDGCVVDWHEAVAHGDGHRYAYASYLGIDAQGGPTVADYRAARAALALVIGVELKEPANG